VALAILTNKLIVSQQFLIFDFPFSIPAAVCWDLAKNRIHRTCASSLELLSHVLVRAMKN
jgi:ABC-type polysaccharide transport system permease subunit